MVAGGPVAAKGDGRRNGIHGSSLPLGAGIDGDRAGEPAPEGGIPGRVCYLGPVPVVERSEPPQLLLSGEIDIASADGLRAAGARAIGSLGSAVRLDIDMSEVTFIDSSGLGALVSIRNAAEAAGRTVSLRINSPPIIRLFELTGLRDSFVILPGDP